MGALGPEDWSTPRHTGPMRSPLFVFWLWLAALTLVWDETALVAGSPETQLSCAACLKLANAIEKEFARSSLAKEVHSAAGESSSSSSSSTIIQSEEREGATQQKKDKKAAALAKVQRALKDVDRIQREAVATDILEASC